MTQRHSRSKPLVIQFANKTPTTASVIFMHGLGDTAYGWKDAAEYLHQQNPHIKFILPTAPTRPVTLNMGMEMPSWYDIIGLSDRSSEDLMGLDESKDSVTELIQSEISSGRDASRIGIGGFSQGGALSLYTAYQFPNPLACVIALSSYLPRDKSFPNVVNKTSLSTPLLMCHGEADPLVKYQWGVSSFKVLEGLGVQGTFKSYKNLVHSANDQEIEDVNQFLKKVLPP